MEELTGALLKGGHVKHYLRFYVYFCFLKLSSTLGRHLIAQIKQSVLGNSLAPGISKYMTPKT